MKFSLIAAVDKKYGIGKKNDLPWRLPSDFKYFSHVTTGGGNNTVIMGRSTWESLGHKSQPLKNRLNIVLTRHADFTVPEGVLVARSLDEALRSAQEKNVDEIFVIGGGEIFKQAISHPACEKIYLTEIDSVFECDTFFPQFDKNVFKKVSESPIHEENKLTFRFVVYAAQK